MPLIDSLRQSSTKLSQHSRRSAERSTSSANSGTNSQLSDREHAKSLTLSKAKSQSGETSKRTLPSVLSLYLFLLLSITLRILSSKSEKLGRQCSTSLRALRENSKPQAIPPRKRRKQSRTSKTLGSKRSWKSSRSSSKA